MNSLLTKWRCAVKRYASARNNITKYTQIVEGTLIGHDINYTYEHEIREKAKRIVLRYPAAHFFLMFLELSQKDVCKHLGKVMPELILSASKPWFTELTYGNTWKKKISFYRIKSQPDRLRLFYRLSEAGLMVDYDRGEMYEFFSREFFKNLHVTKQILNCILRDDFYIPKMTLDLYTKEIYGGEIE